MKRCRFDSIWIRREWVLICTNTSDFVAASHCIIFASVHCTERNETKKCKVS
jgi:hypothetical protein